MNEARTVVILAGGKGIRLRPHAELIPKALVPLGGMPMIWHIMKMYSISGYSHFLIALGHKGDMIAEWFEHYRGRRCDFTLHMDGSAPEFHIPLPEDERAWRITFVHSGEETETAGRLLRLRSYIQDEHFLATYSDGLSSVNIAEIARAHHSSGLPATMLSVRSPSRFGIVEAEHGRATRFDEKPHGRMRINGGFFVFHRSVLDRISGDDAVLERDILEPIAREGGLGVYEHDGFWHCLDTQKDLHTLEQLWESGTAPWKCWME